MLSLSISAAVVFFLLSRLFYLSMGQMNHHFTSTREKTTYNEPKHITTVNMHSQWKGKEKQALFFTFREFLRTDSLCES